MAKGVQRDSLYKEITDKIIAQLEQGIVPWVQPWNSGKQGIEIGAGWTKKGETSGKEYVSLALAAPEFGQRKLYANLGKAAGQDDDTLYALIWNPTD